MDNQIPCPLYGLDFGKNACANRYGSIISPREGGPCIIGKDHHCVMGANGSKPPNWDECPVRNDPESEKIFNGSFWVVIEGVFYGHIKDWIKYVEKVRKDSKIQNQ